MLQQRHCAKEVLKTVLIEKCTLPRSKPCGGGVPLKSLQLIGTRIPEELVDQQIRCLKFFSKTRTIIELRHDSPIAISTTRDKFDAFLSKLATDEGCMLIQSNGLKDLSIEKDAATCILSNNQIIKARIVIGADGVTSLVARKSGIRQKWKANEVGLCLETSIALPECEMKKIDSDAFEVYFIDALRGYSWLFPKKSSISVGIGSFLSNIYRPNEVLLSFCKSISKTKKLEIYPRNITAHLIPAGGFNRNIVANRIMLVGDACRIC